MTRDAVQPVSDVPALAEVRVGDVDAERTETGGVLDHFETHAIKVVPPYLDALREGGKTFEVRKNDRAYQRGDMLILHEWHPAYFGATACHKCRNLAWDGHYTGRKAVRWVTYVYSGDPRFGGIEPGFVVLGLGSDDYTAATESA